MILQYQFLHFHNPNESEIPNRGEINSSEFWNLTASRIYIDDTQPNFTWSKTASEFEWCSGIGTLDDPYIIENITIDCQALEYGIQIRNSQSFFIVRNCSVYNQGNFSGRGSIMLYNVSNGRFINNNITSNHNGIRLDRCKDNLIEGNIVLNNTWGVTLIHSINNSILNSRFKSNKYGIWLAGGGPWGNSYYNTISKNNVSQNQNGMFIGGNTNYITKNTINNNEIQGIHLHFSFYNVLSKNVINYNNKAIYLFESSNNDIIDNTINFNQIGIYYIRSCNNFICNNSFFENQENFEGENYDLDCDNKSCSQPFNLGLTIFFISILITGSLFFIFIWIFRKRIGFKNV